MLSYVNLCSFTLHTIYTCKSHTGFFYLYFHLDVMIAKVIQMFEFDGVKVISSPTYYRHVNMYIQPKVHMFWERHQKESIDTFMQTNSSGLIVAGDGRCDSPGHCAGYGSYTFMEQRYNKVLHFKLVQVNTFYVSMSLLAFLSRPLKLVLTYYDLYRIFRYFILSTTC